ncbi:hypothetical protein BA81_14197 [Bacillus safensis FO-36b]|uniref:hypothetical protein n=1 Tax=Bacillus safensis TaxID=561879 RepID=UPI00045CDC00|nr:hypothetical protein [Bacillus safensis]KDE26705.1 hypothetical protein BA81_14197 [Bacillus safensis FO-36b]MCM3050275.1 hypothetical protein [Bacillus safensis]MEC1048605.1 hypothetical protein [Bacillus safensis]
MNENNPIISSVITKLHQQQEKGLQKYGVEVETSSYDLKGWLEHAQQEAIDFTTYLETAIQLLEEQVKSKKEEMKFYEVNEPYYALIKAKNDENAMTIYTDVVADDDGGLSEEITEVTEAYATIIYSRVNGEDNNVIPVKEVLEHLTNEEEMVLIIDGSLI